MDDDIRRCNPNQRFDPDPFGICLAVLGAVGSAASIFTVVEDRIRREKFRRRSRERIEIFRVTSEIRGALAELRSNYRYLIKRFVRNTEDSEPNVSNMPSRFGAVRVVLSPATVDEYRETVAAIFEGLHRYHTGMIELSHRVYLYLDHFDIPPVQRLMDLRRKADDILSREHSARDAIIMTEDLLSQTEDALDQTFDWILHNE